MENWNGALGAFLVLLVGVLYVLELAPRPEDGMVELNSIDVVMVAKCDRVFNYVSNLNNYAKWFPGIANVTAVAPGPMENGKQFEETVSFPVYGHYTRLMYVTVYDPPTEVQFTYQDLSMVAVTMKLSQQTTERCLLTYSASTRRTSLLYHAFMGIPLRIMYALRGRHAMFAVRAMYNYG